MSNLFREFDQMIIGRFDKWGRGCSGVQDGGQTKRVTRYRNEITHWLSTSWRVNKSLSLSRPADLLAAVSMMRVLFLEIDLHSSVKTKKSCGKGREKNVGKMEKFKWYYGKCRSAGAASAHPFQTPSLFF